MGRGKQENKNTDIGDMIKKQRKLMLVQNWLWHFWRNTPRTTVFHFHLLESTLNLIQDPAGDKKKLKPSIEKELDVFKNRFDGMYGFVKTLYFINKERGKDGLQSLLLDNAPESSCPEPTKKEMMIMQIKEAWERQLAEEMIGRTDPRMKKVPREDCQAPDLGEVKQSLEKAIVNKIKEDLL